MLSNAQKAEAISALSRRREVLAQPMLEGQFTNYLLVTNEFMKMVRWRQFDISISQMTDATECMEFLLQIVHMWIKVFSRIQQVEDSITTANSTHGDSQQNVKGD